MSKLWRPFSVPGSRSSMEVATGNAAHIGSTDGRKYIDATSGLWNVSLGYGNPAVIGEMRKQLERLSFCALFDSTHSPAEVLSERLVKLTNERMQYVYLSTSGSSAVEVALRVARLHFRALGKIDKRKIVSFDLGYHGCSAISGAASGILSSDLLRAGELLPDFVNVASPVDEVASLAHIERLFSEDAESIAALVVEPILGSGGIIVPTVGYWKEINRLCERHDVLLVADEVATGGGRCGAMFASDVLGLAPDIITLSKGINSGYFPVGVTMFSERVVRPMAAASMVFQYGSTQDGNPVGCASALATLDIVHGAGFFERINQVGGFIRERILSNAAGTVVREVRGLGLMIGVELAHLDAQRTPFSDRETYMVRQACMDAGLLVYHFQSGISLFPPLIVSDEEAEDIADIIGEVVRGFI